MKYDVKFSCGHTEERDLVGTYASRKEKIKYWEESGMCSKCYEARKDAELMKNHDKVEMHYSEYKNKYAECKTVLDSYNKKTKTIIVYVPRK